jgi:hypothetical protein
MQRGAPPGEPGHREVEAAPEEMDRADLAQEGAAEELQDTIGLDEREPESMRGVGVIARVNGVIGKGDGIRYFVRRLVDRDFDAHPFQKNGYTVIEVGDALRFERKRLELPIAVPRNKPMVVEIEFDVEDFVAEWDRRRGEPAGCHVERHLPAMIDPRRET